MISWLHTQNYNDWFFKIKIDQKLVYFSSKVFNFKWNGAESIWGRKDLKQPFQCVNTINTHFTTIWFIVLQTTIHRHKPSKSNPNYFAFKQVKSRGLELASNSPPSKFHYQMPGCRIREILKVQPMSNWLHIIVHLFQFSIISQF